MKLIAHRCGPPPLYENSIAAARYSFDNGADGLEIDFRLSADGIPFGFHDETLERIAGDKRRINDCASESLLKLGDEKSGFPASIKSIIDFSRFRGFVLLHFKEVSKEHTEALSVILYEEMISNVYCGISSVEHINLLNKTGRKLSYLAFIDTPDEFRDFDINEVKVIRLWESWVNRDIVSKIHAMGKEVWVMTGKPVESFGGITTVKKVKKLKEADVDGILVNDPALFKEFKNGTGFSR